MKCTCGSPDCETEISFGDNSLIVSARTKETTMMYFDANTCVEIIKELKGCLLRMTELTEETDC